MGLHCCMMVPSWYTFACSTCFHSDTTVEQGRHAVLIWSTTHSERSSSGLQHPAHCGSIGSESIPWGSRLAGMLSLTCWRVMAMTLFTGFHGSRTEWSWFWWSPDFFSCATSRLMFLTFSEMKYWIDCLDIWYQQIPLGVNLVINMNF